MVKLGKLDLDELFEFNGVKYLVMEKYTTYILVRIAYDYPTSQNHRKFSPDIWVRRVR